MPSVPRLSVGARLILTMVVVVALSWLVGGALVFQLIRLGVLRRPGRPPGPPPPGAAAPSQRPGGERLFAPEARGGERGRRPPPPYPGERGREGRPPPPGGGPGEGRPPRPPRPFWGDPRLLANLGIGVLLSVAAGIWLSRRFTRPLVMLAEGARALRSGTFGHRIPLTGDDEFGRVATSMNQMAQRIGDQIQALQADSLRRQQLLADVAHELRSPVATLKTMAEALRDGVAASPERMERATSAIVESAARMERLVNDLIELARLDLDEFPLHPVPVDLRMAAMDCLRRHSHAAESAGIRLHPLAEGAAAVVSGDPHRLAQILDNLVDNTLSHAGAGAEVRVMVEPGDPVTVTVTDTGRGIPAEDLPYVFDAFYRGDAARTPGGRHSGLGLRIARALAQAHGGDLQIESKENQGTRAILTLPALRESA